ncbi:site-specific integrase [Nonomuraea sp. NN258]|uniref:tyrosine-type recombinase/integrase n=1 Tax=Nonomuraea antri TaxID=2730852 RepID=UPI0015680A7D|nr:site-specific integrase [Nonomuraea antri]NRQ34312.1 site-specific integrase [Nonomuraea antri]
MTKRRSKGDGGLHWDDKRQRWIATASLGFDPSGKRIVKRGSGKTKTEAKNKLKEVLRDYEDGLIIAPGDYTVGQAANDWLTYGLSGLDQNTVTTTTILCKTHIIPALGKRRLRELSAQDVDKWLAEKAKSLSTSTLSRLHSCLNRIIKRAMARDKVRRNVVELCRVPQGRKGRPSKSLTMTQAEEVLKASGGRNLHAYIVVSLLTGARTEELRALCWDHVDLVGHPDAVPSVPPYIAVWRSVRNGGDTKTRKSRRTLALPARCVDALIQQRAAQQEDQGDGWSEHGLVFASTSGTELDAANVRRAFRRVIKRTSLNAAEWTPRELRHSFVSLLSDAGTPLEEISRLVGHSSTAVTELVYRKQIRPVLQEGAVVMDRIFMK